MPEEVINIEDIIFSGDENSNDETISVDDIIFEPGKTTDPASRSTDSGSVDFSSELPLVTRKDTRETEEVAIKKLRSRFGGLGFTFEETGITGDYITITSPPDKDGNTKTEEFSFDNFFRNLFGGDKAQADKINSFIKNNYQKEGMINAVDVDVYARTIKHAENTENATRSLLKQDPTVSITSGPNKGKKIEDLTAKEIEAHQKQVFLDVMEDNEIWSDVVKEITPSLEQYTAEQTRLMAKKHDLYTQAGVDQANIELEKLVRAKQEELVNNSTEYKKLVNSVSKAVVSKYGHKDMPGSLLNEKYVLEAEEEILPFSSALRNIPLIGDTWADMSHGFGVGRMQIAKGDNEYRNVIAQGYALKNEGKEISDLKQMLKDGASESDPYRKMSSPSMREGVSREEYNGTIGDRIKTLQDKIPERVQIINGGISKSNEYQEKLSRLDPAEIFDKSIFNPQVTTDEFQRMLGTQGAQMIGGMLLYPTFAQESGGIATESIVIESARKIFPNLSDEKAKQAFQELDEKARTRIMTQVVENGEVNFKPAVKYGAAAASLDIVGNFFVFSKAAKAVPTSVLRDIKRFAFKKVLTSQGAKGLYAATAVESITEAFQEALGIGGVSAATGYMEGGKFWSENNVKRMMEGAGQAFLTTPFLTAGGKVAVAGKKEFNARVFANPKQARALINNKKKQVDQAMEDGLLTQEERDNEFSQLEAVEDMVNNIDQYKKMDVEQKEATINSLVQRKQLEKRKREIEVDNDKIKKANTGGVGNIETLQNQTRINNIDAEISEKNNEILQEVVISNYFQDGRLAEFINTTEEGSFKGKKFKRFENKKQANEYFQKFFENESWLSNSSEILNTIEKFTNDGLTVEDAKTAAFIQHAEHGDATKLQQMLDMKRLWDGSVNAATLNNDAWVVDENVIANIRKGDLLSTNAFHHEGLHFIQDNMSTAQLEEMKLAIENELFSSKDPKLLKLAIAAEKFFNIRYGGKFKKDDPMYYKEWMTNLSDVMKVISLTDLNEENTSTLLNIGNIFGNTFKSQTQMTGMDWSKFDAGNALQYIQKWNKFQGVSSGITFRMPRGKVNTEQEDKKADGKVLASEGVYKDINDAFLDYADVDRELAANVAADMMQGIVFDRLTKLKDAGLIEGFDTKDLEDIQLQFTGDPKNLPKKIKNRGAVGLLKGFDLGFKGGVMGYFNAEIRGRKMLDMRLQEFVENHPKYGSIQVSLQDEGVTTAVDKQQAALSPEEIMIQKEQAKLTDLDRALNEGKTPKTDILKTGRKDTRQSVINTVTLKKGDTFTEVLDIKNIDGNTGKVSEIVFNVPAKKILDRNENGKPISANLTYAKKIIDGIPEPSEAGNIQDYYANEQAITSEIKTLPKTNVASKDAEVNKDGDKVKVSRETLGRAVGLSNSVLNYFYNKKLKPDGKRARSQGLTSQVALWEIKDEFINPSLKTIKKAQKEFFGITPVGQLNTYNRVIGQNLKGFAKHTASKKALSAAARKSDDTQQIADIRAGISNITAFSETVDGYMDGYGNVELNFEIEQKIINAVLNHHLGIKMHTYKTQKDIDNLIVDIKKHVIPILPGNVLTYNTFVPSDRHLGKTKKDIIVVEGKEMTIKEYYVQEMKKLTYDGNKIGKGKPFNSAGAKYKQGITYATQFGLIAKDIKQTIVKGRKISGTAKNPVIMTAKQINAMNMSMHEQMWERINKSIKDTNGKSAKVWANWFSTVANNTEHPHRMGAEFLGFSTNPKGYTNPKSGNFKLYEWEHAMPASRAYNYLMHSILSGLKESKNFKDYSFAGSYILIQNNYKLIALDKNDDEVKLKGAGHQTSMGVGWNLSDLWLDRYFADVVAEIEGGIDPKGIEHINGKTFDKVYNVSSRGAISAIIKQDVGKASRLNSAVIKSRTSKFSETSNGITVLDFDDTLATTKSGVRAKIPNADGLPKPKRKVIFLAGGAGSGKSNVVKKLELEKQGFKIVNQDISLEWLKKNNGLPENMNNLTKEQRSKLGSLQHQARGIAKRKMIKYKGNADGVVVDGTGGSIKSMEKLVNEFKDKGYDVSMLFVETSLPVALERNAARKERSLLDKIVEKNHELVQGNKNGFKTMFGNRFMEVNTDNLSQQDAMPSKLTNKMNDFVSGYENRRLDAEEFASEGADILEQGGTFDFSEFNKVVEGQKAPLFEKAMKLQGKFGNKDMFVLTARPAESASAIFEFLQANGLNIPIENITGLANSTSEAKALWMADKVAEGYNDFYFADDALQNVQAVQNMLDQFDVKSKVQQAKVKFSESMSDQFNSILENVTGIESGKRFSIIKGRKRGESKGKFRVFVPPSHEDFVGLLYNFLGKGKEGNAHRDFFEQALVRPLNRANRELDTARQSVANDYKALNKQFEDVKKKLSKKTPDGDFTFQDAVRVYLWDKHDHKIPGLSETDQAKLAELVMSNPQLKAYAETLNVISKQETYVNPTEGWNSGDIRMDLDDATGRIGRGQHFAEFIENSNIIFSEENLNKIEAGYGKEVRESLEDILYRIETGRNRPTGQNAQVNKLMNYLNGSVGTVMFFNMRSALLQQMSIVNYINFDDNNIFAAAKAFANQKQYWADWSFIFNSDMLKQRRGGIQTDVNGAELAASLRNSKNISRKLVSKLLELGFLPTQIGDNIAIATGGATYYRNRINKYIKQGMSKKEAEAAAFTDFQDITQSTQQSARPDMVSKQQASVIGKVILNFQNVTSQFNRLGKKAFQDIYNRRITKPNTTQMQSDISNASRITYYFAVQNLIFYTLQTALFAMMFDDEEEDNNNLFLKKKERLINGSIDSVLRGTGLIGGVVATLKNVAIAFARQRDVNYNPDESAVMLEALNLSPVLGIKGRKIVNAEKTLNYNKKVIDEMETFDIDNPQWSAVTNYTEALTNAPLNRLYNKTQNVRQALNNEHAAWERTLMFLGWSQYNLNIMNDKVKQANKTGKNRDKRPF